MLGYLELKVLLNLVEEVLYGVGPWLFNTYFVM